MKRNLSLLIRLFFTFLLTIILLVIGNIMYSNDSVTSNEFFSMLVISFFTTPFFWLVWEIEIRLRQDKKQKNTSSDHESNTMEKRKRERIDTVLRDLSDDDLHRLRTRLSTMDDDDLEQQLIGDDGELLIEAQVE